MKSSEETFFCNYDEDAIECLERSCKEMDVTGLLCRGPVCIEIFFARAHLENFSLFWAHHSIKNKFSNMKDGSEPKTFQK